MIRIKRAYEPPSDQDGTRILVDRLWPRGITKDRIGIDHWDKSIAPSTGLRKWFGHDPEKWVDFQKRYRTELLENSPQVLERLAMEAREGCVTLVYGARDVHHNGALVLKSLLEELGGDRGTAR